MPCHIYEADFGRLLGLLKVDTDTFERMQQIAFEAANPGATAEREELQRAKAEAIDLCHRRIEAAVHLYGDGRITRTDYLDRVATNEREIEAWEARTADTDVMTRELSRCYAAVTHLNEVWVSDKVEDKQQGVMNLFVAVLYDLDIRRIVGFSVKPWVERYLMLRASLPPEPTDGSTKPNKGTFSEGEDVVQDVVPKGFCTTRVPCRAA